MPYPESVQEKPFRSNTLRYLRRAVGALAVTGAAITGIYFGEKAAIHTGRDRSAIVDGVPGLVVAHKSQNNSSLLFDSALHWLKIEQCPVDATEQDSQPSYSDSPGSPQLKADCYEDWALVTTGTAARFTDGESIIFNGSPQEHLNK